MSLAGGGQGPRDVRPRPPLLLPGALSPGAGPRSGQLSLCQHMIYYNVFIYFIYLCIYYIKKGGLVFEAHLRALKSFK